MSIISIPLAGQLGVVKDVSPAEVPVNAWTDCLNIRFKDGGLMPSGAVPQMMELPFQAEWALPVQGPKDIQARWVLAGTEEVYALQGITLTDITPEGTFSLPQAGLNWSGGILGTCVVLHNSELTPWVWLVPKTDPKMVVLEHWPTGMKAYTLRSFKQYLVALGITRDGKFYPSMVKWSHPADPGSIPISWDETDPTRDAGETVLAETPGQCIDCVTLGDVNIIYKQDSVWGMQYIGGVYIFRFYKIFGDFGIPARNCAVEYTSGRHFVFTGFDLILHDGNTMQSIADGKVKSILRNISANSLKNCYVVNNPSKGEVWLCYPGGASSTFADSIIVYNYLENHFSLRSLPNLRFIGLGRVDPWPAAESIWETDSGAWDEDEVIWDADDNSYVVPRMLGLGEGNLYWVDVEEAPAVAPSVERLYLGFPVNTTTPPDLSIRKFVRRIWPRITGVPGAVVEITLGAADSVSEEIIWKSPMTYTIGETRHLDCTLSGKVFGLRLTGVTESWWKYAGLDADVTALGEL